MTYLAHEQITSERSLDGLILMFNMDMPANSSSSITAHEESRIPSRPHLGSVPSPQAIPSPGDWGWEKCDGQCLLRPPRLDTSCSAASARRPARGTASVTGQTCSALHCALAKDSVMDTELTARPNTNSGLHYMLNYMYRGRLSWIQILQLHIFFT